VTQFAFSKDEMRRRGQKASKELRKINKINTQPGPGSTQRLVLLWPGPSRRRSQQPAFVNK
jgi:hypothetical protein